MQYLNKYVGQAAYLGNRIFMVDYQCSAKDAITQCVLFPAGRERFKYLKGVVFGISSRQGFPYMSPVIFQYLGTNIDVRSAMKLAGLIEPDADKISPHVLNLLGPPDIKVSQMFINNALR